MWRKKGRWLSWAPAWKKSFSKARTRWANMWMPEVSHTRLSVSIRRRTTTTTRRPISLSVRRRPCITPATDWMRSSLRWKVFPRRKNLMHSRNVSASKWEHGTSSTPKTGGRSVCGAHSKTSWCWMGWWTVLLSLSGWLVSGHWLLESWVWATSC